MVSLPATAKGPLIKAAQTKIFTGITHTNPNLDNVRQRLDFNAIHQPHVRPQFTIEPYAEGYPLLVPNGGLGDCQIDNGYSLPTFNGAVMSRETYYCSSVDEEDQYTHLMGGEDFNSFTARGTYRFFKITDRWRLERDDKVFFWGVPEVATNGTRWGNKGSVDYDLWHQVGHPDGPFSTNRRDGVGQEFRGRNFVRGALNDEYRAGRYLFKYINPDEFSVLQFAQPTEEISAGANEVYRGFFIEPTYIDCPFSRINQRYAFMCATMAVAGAYEDLEPGPPILRAEELDGPMEPERCNIYKDLLRQALDYMGYQIDQGYWGHVRPPLSKIGGSYTPDPWEGNEREMSGIVLTVYEILNKMEERISCRSGTGWLSKTWDKAYRTAKRFSKKTPNIEGYCGEVPQDTLVEVKKVGSAVHVILRSDLCGDIQSKRTKDSDPHFNVQSHPDQNAYENRASYGIMQDGGIYEQFFTPNRGYKWVMDEATSGMRADPISGLVDSHGYAAILVAEFAHQFIHRHFREIKGAFTWETPQAAYEEQLARMGAALIFHQLLQLGYVRNQFGMRTEKYNWWSEVTMPESYEGRRFFYRDAPTADHDIYIGAAYEDYYVIAHNLKNREHEMARMAAHMMAVCPFFEEPGIACLNGICGANRFVERERAEYTPPPITETIDEDSCPGGDCSDMSGRGEALDFSGFSLPVTDIAGVYQLGTTIGDGLPDGDPCRESVYYPNYMRLTIEITDAGTQVLTDSGETWLLGGSFPEFYRRDNPPIDEDYLLTFVPGGEFTLKWRPNEERTCQRPWTQSYRRIAE